MSLPLSIFTSLRTLSTRLSVVVSDSVVIWLVTLILQNTNNVKKKLVPRLHTQIQGNWKRKNFSVRQWDFKCHIHMCLNTLKMQNHISQRHSIVLWQQSCSSTYVSHLLYAMLWKPHQKTKEIQSEKKLGEYLSNSWFFKMLRRSSISNHSNRQGLMESTVRSKMQSNPKYYRDAGGSKYDSYWSCL